MLTEARVRCSASGATYRLSAGIQRHAEAEAGASVCYVVDLYRFHSIVVNAEIGCPELVGKSDLQ